MEITFLVGNGFDRNLGLKTAYSDFVQVYKKEKSENKNIENFKEYIETNKELWKDAELALGKYTEYFDAATGTGFSDCQEDFEKSLAVYLMEETQRINYDACYEVICKAFSRINTLTEIFPDLEKSTLDKIYNNFLHENRYFNFLNFNYTYTLENCINIIKNPINILGTHIFNSNKKEHKFGKHIHVHGTVEKNMVFGVNDETQISKNEIFNFGYGEIYKNQLIKQKANESYMDDVDGKAHDIINKSNIIFIYGMSIGETDKLWWQRICNWLAKNEMHHLIIYSYDMPIKGAIPLRFLLHEKTCKNKFLEYGEFEYAQKSKIESQIHITNVNIFEDVKNIAEETAQMKVDKLLSLAN